MVAFERCQSGGFWGWRTSHGSVEIYFGGKGPDLPHEATLRHVLPGGVEPSWLRQIHSATVLDADPGNNGPGDALVTQRRDLALSVVTADCVPVLLASDRGLAAVHAGWRGLAQSILPVACRRLAGASGPVKAWIGPTIGRCCYEVGDEVARRVCAASTSTVIRVGPRGRPHLDLVAAARVQLEQCGEIQVVSVDVCTFCEEARLWSYRREGRGAGRNVSAIWRSPKH